MAGFPARLYRQDIKRQGRDVVLVRKPTAQVDPAKPWLGPVAPGAPDRITVRAKPKAFSTDEIDALDPVVILHQGRVAITDTVEAVRASNNDHVQDLLQRRPRRDPVDADAYLDRLTEGHF